MTKEDKQLLLIDLCGRLPYGGDLYAEIVWVDGIARKVSFINTGVISDLICDDVESIKPYLRPMLSMTEEEKEELYQRTGFRVDDCILGLSAIDWLNAHYFDYRGLIPMGLALEATEGMY